jgi:hypothetical protein
MIKNKMRTLVIHPRDPSTEFLKNVYKNLSDITLIRGDVSRGEIICTLQEHDRIIMLGHGSEKGLLSADVFDTESRYIIDDAMFPWLFGKENIFIWCHADLFAFFNHLNGFFTGMFISEMREAIRYKLKNATIQSIEASNHLFASILGELIHLSSASIYPAVCEAYGQVAVSNVVAEYNLKRLLYLSGNEFTNFKSALNQ